jgi:hypothetical protein
MATTYKVLGQSAPTAATATSLYTVPSVTEAVISTINVVNTHASTADVIRIAVRPNGATLANEHYIVYSLSLAAGSTFTYTGGVTVDATDVITVYSTNGTSSLWSLWIGDSIMSVGITPNPCITGTYWSNRTHWTNRCYWCCWCYFRN